MLKFSKECDRFAHEIDEFLFKKDFEGMISYLPGLKAFANEHDTPEYAPIFYYLGTICGELANQLHREGKNYLDHDIVEYRKSAMLYFRKALKYIPNPSETFLVLPLLTNYANDVDSCGRILEALRLFREAIKIQPQFALALGNYGRTLSSLANMVNDGGHYKELHCYAFQAMSRAMHLKDPNFHDDARKYFEKALTKYSDMTGIPVEYLKTEITFKHYDLGSGEECMYRNWCLENHLFLNPLNDVMDLESAFAHDPLTISHYTEYIYSFDLAASTRGEPPRWFAMLNQLKEEYVYSRYLCFSSIQASGKVHYADKSVKLSNGLDYASYSIRLEQLKSAFKILYGMFDQIAYFINDFWSMGFAEKKADANRVFKSEKYPMDNFALVSLYWTYREFWDCYEDAEVPYEKNLVNLRNALEHKFVKIHEFPWNRELKLENDNFYHLDESAFEKFTMRLLVLAREALMYLVYAIGINENKKDSKNTDSKAVSLSVLDFVDDWKR